MADEHATVTAQMHREQMHRILLMQRRHHRPTGARGEPLARTHATRLVSHTGTLDWRVRQLD
eukprot:2631522-Prymnesium_polylepis.1